MSRIGRKPVPLPEKVGVEINLGTVVVTLATGGTIATILGTQVVTLATGGTIAGLAAVQALTLGSNPVVEAGHYIGAREGNSAAMPTVSIFGFSYEKGK